MQASQSPFTVHQETKEGILSGSHREGGNQKLTKTPRTILVHPMRQPPRSPCCVALSSSASRTASATARPAWGARKVSRGSSGRSRWRDRCVRMERVRREGAIRGCWCRRGVAIHQHSVRVYPESDLYLAWSIDRTQDKQAGRRTRTLTLQNLDKHLPLITHFPPRSPLERTHEPILLSSPRALLALFILTMCAIRSMRIVFTSGAG